MVWKRQFVVFLVTSYACLFANVLSTPIQHPFLPSNGPIIIPEDFCILPPEFGTQGMMTYLEDCDTLFQLPVLPIPVGFSQKYGTHSLVCCPKRRYKSGICFPSDAWCPTYEEPDYGQVEDESINGRTQIPQQPTMANRTCFKTLIGSDLTLDSCVNINQCSSLLTLAPTNAPQFVMQPCGYNEEDQSLMICCPDSLIENPQRLTQPPRFPLENGKSRECDDAHKLCTRWKENNGCALDVDFPLSDDPNGHVVSKTMFDFMQGACLQSCGWCGSKGCVDEHPNCQIWARNGMCVVNPFVMAHTCRESCGVCGFLSPFNNEDQKVRGNSYSDFTNNDFDCGRYKPLKNVDSNDEITIDSLDLRLTEETSDEVFFATQGLLSQDGGDPDFFCGATVISDRWVVAAAHCYDLVSSQLGPRQVQINTIRENTQFKDIIEIKRIIKHPLYKYPNLYNDVAILELGRRIEYDWEIFGDSPSCLDNGLQKEGKLATIQGFGLTENGTRGRLLEANVTIISNEKCIEILKFNFTTNELAESKTRRALPQGLEYGLLCAQGFLRDGVFSGSCIGDSGGPLTTNDENERKYLVGIVSGGVGCGKGYPGWYTSVEFFFSWIQCLIETSKEFGGKISEIEEKCKSEIIEPKKCSEITNFGTLFADLQNNDCETIPEEDFLVGGLTKEGDTLFGDLRSSVK